MYRLSSAGEGALGKLEIRWRSQLGDSGRLQTQQILAAPALSRDASLAAVSLPAVRPRWWLCGRPPPDGNSPNLLSMLRACWLVTLRSAPECMGLQAFRLGSASRSMVHHERCHQAAVTRINELVPRQSVPVEQPFPVRLRVQSRVNASFRRLHLCAPAPAAAAAPGGAPPAVVLQVPAARVRCEPCVAAVPQAGSAPCRAVCTVMCSSGAEEQRILLNSAKQM